jgi:hypothetical protein
MRYFLLLFLIGVLISCKDVTVIGHWRRLDFQPGNMIAGKPIQPGDLIIRKDSTFQIMGEENSVSKIPGWHTSLSVEGNWAMPDEDHLNLQLHTSPIGFALNFKIMKCNWQELQLLSSMFPGDSSQTFKYKRIPN